MEGAPFQLCDICKVHEEDFYVGPFRPQLEYKLNHVPCDRCRSKWVGVTDIHTPTCALCRIRYIFDECGFMLRELSRYLDAGGCANCHKGTTVPQEEYVSVEEFGDFWGESSESSDGETEVAKQAGKELNLHQETATYQNGEGLQDVPPHAKDASQDSEQLLSVDFARPVKRQKQSVRN
jgi:hypothetical protein